MSYLNRIDKLLVMFEKALIVMLFVALAGSIIFNILSRNLFGASFQDILEATPTLVLWLALAGSTLAMKDRRHIKLELVLRFCPRAFRHAANTAVSIFGMAVMGLLFYASLTFVSNEIAIFGASGWFAVIFPFFFAISFFRYLTWIAVPERPGPPRPGAGADGPIPDASTDRP